MVAILDFWKIQKLLIKNTENISNLFKLSISMGKLEIKMKSKKFDVKNCQKSVLKKWLPWQWLNWYGSNQHTIVFLDKVYDKSPNFVAVAVFVAKI